MGTNQKSLGYMIRAQKTVFFHLRLDKSYFHSMFLFMALVVYAISCSESSLKIMQIFYLFYPSLVARSSLSTSCSCRVL